MSIVLLCLLSIYLLFYCVYCLLYLLCLLFYCVYCTYSVYCSTVSTVYCVYSVCCALHKQSAVTDIYTKPASSHELLLPKIVTDIQTDSSTFHPPLHIAIVQLLQLNKMAQIRRHCNVPASTKPFRGIATFTAMSQYCGELWVSRKGNETATNETSSRYYFLLLRDVVKCLRTLTVADGSRKWMLHWYDISICQLCRWWLISMPVCSILVLYLHRVLIVLTENQFRAVLRVVSKGFHKLYIKQHHAANENHDTIYIFPPYSIKY